MLMIDSGDDDNDELNKAQAHYLRQLCASSFSSKLYHEMHLIYISPSIGNCCVQDGNLCYVG